MCEFDPDLIALHAGSDLPAEESRLVEAHLRTCDECRSLLGKYAQRIGLVAESVTDVQYPHAEFPVRNGWDRRWLAAVVTVLVIASALITKGPAIAALVREIRFGPNFVREMDAVETEQYREAAEHRLHEPAPGPSIASDKVTVAEAIQAVNYQVLQPTYLPDGYEVQWASITPNDPTSHVSIAYWNAEKGQIVISQSPPNDSARIYRNVPEGASQSVTVSGLPAVVIRGGWASTDGKVRWLDTFSSQLSYTKGDQLITVTHGRPDFPTEELIKIAESLQ